MRLTFARSLINNPELLFLDEPTTGLDPVNAREVKDIVLDLKARGRTVFLTTHDMATADELCDRVAFVVDGRIQAMDTPAELKIARASVWYASNIEAERGFRDRRVRHGQPRRQCRVPYPVAHPPRGDNSQREASLDDVFVDVTGRQLS